MAERVCTNFIDDDGLDIGCHLVSKEYVLENYPALVPWMKAPALWIWGSNNSGRLGDNSSIVSISSPLQTISGGTNWLSIEGASLGTFGIKTDGTLWAWGSGAFGTLGDNTGTGIERSSPVQTISSGTNWKQISAASSSAGGLKTDGTLWVWGSGSFGVLGDNTVANKSSPVQTISGGTNWKKISFSNAPAALKTDGTLWAWGLNTGGQLGDDTIISKSTPVQNMTGGTNWKSVSGGGNNTAAIKIDGTLWVWGCGTYGRLGTNNIINRSSPVQTFSGGTDWKSVSIANGHTAAIKTDGSLWVWGRNNFAQLGNNSITTAAVGVSSPIQTVSGGTNWFKVVAAFCNTGAIKTDGTLWTWGLNVAGQLGDDTIISKSSPVQIITGGTGWKDISIGGCHMIAIRDEGDF